MDGGTVSAADLLHAGAADQSRPPADDGVFDSRVTYTVAIKDAGVLLDAQRLAPQDTATSVAVPAGERLLTDGPSIETKECLFAIIAAVSGASGHLGSTAGVVAGVRPGLAAASGLSAAGALAALAAGQRRASLAPDSQPAAALESGRR